MAPLVNDDYSQSGRLVKRRYVQIPKDQKKLLENAWVETLNHGQHPMLNVPDGVIQHAKDTIHKRRRASLQQASSNRARLSPRSSSNKRLYTHNDDEAEESDREVSWSPSPCPDRRHVEEDGPLEDEPDEPLEPEFRPSSLHHHHQQQQQQQQHSSPPKSPLKWKAPSNFNNSESQSSGAQSDGLDIEPPGFAAQEVEPPVNRTASRVIATGSRKLEATPPSAQLPVQTARDTQVSVKQPPAKRRRMEGSHLSDKTREPRKSVSAVQSRSSPPAQRNIVANRPSNSSSISQQLPQLSQTSAAPYELFKAAYPDYCGNSRDFVAALLILKKLVQNRELNQVLFDDFIRAYTGDYFVYVSECSRKDAQKLLPGVQWYNDYVDNAIYQKRIVRRTNLAAFIAAHSDEAHSVRRAIRHDKFESSHNTASQSTPEQSDQDMEGSSNVDEEEAHADKDENELPEPEFMQLDRDEAGARASSDGHIELAGFVTLPTRITHDRMAATAPELPQDALIMTQLSDAITRQNKAGLKSLRQTQDLNCRAALEKAKAAKVLLVEANHGRDSPELHVDAPGATKATASFAVNDTQSQTQRSPSPLEPLMSQESSHKSLQPIASSSPEASPHNEQHTREGPTISLPQRNARLSSLDGPQTTIEATEQNGDEVVAYEPLGVALRCKAKSSYPHRQGSDISDLDEDAFDPPVLSRSQRRARPRSLPRPISVSGDNSEEEGSQTPQPRQPAERSSINKLQDYTMEEDPEDLAGARDLPVSPVHIAGRSTAALLSQQAITRGLDGTSFNESKTDPYDMLVSPAQPTAGSPSANLLSSQAITFGADETFFDENTALKPRVSEKLARKALAPMSKPTFFESKSHKTTTRNSPLRSAKLTLSDPVASAAGAPTKRTIMPPHASRRGGSQPQQTAASPRLSAKQTSPIGEATMRSVVTFTPPNLRQRSVSQPNHVITSPTPLGKSGSPTAKDIAQPPFPSTMPAAMPSGTERRSVTQSEKGNVSPTPFTKPTLSTAAAAVARPIINPTMSQVSSSGLQRNSVTEPKDSAGSIATTPNLSMGIGPSHSTASSISSAKRPRMKQSERTKRLQEFARKRAASGTLASTAATAASSKH